MEQRHKAVLEVLDGANVTDVALLYGVSRRKATDRLVTHRKRVCLSGRSSSALIGTRSSDDDDTGRPDGITEPSLNMVSL